MTLLLLAFASGVASLIYEVAWFQSLELVIGSSAVSLAVLLATFMGGNCLGSLLFARLRYQGLRAYAAMELGIGALALLTLWLMPWVGHVYFNWSDGAGSLWLRGVVAAACLLPAAIAMGATLPALAGAIETEDRLLAGYLYGANIAGAVAGCVLAGFGLLRLYDVATATYVAMAINMGAAVVAVGWASRQPMVVERVVVRVAGERMVYVSTALSGFCALAAETVWTRTLGLLFGASAYTFSIVLAVFLAGLGMGSSIGAVVGRKIGQPRLALAWCQLLSAIAIGWTAYVLTAWLPYWPMNLLGEEGIWHIFAIDIARAALAMLPPTLAWGASFPLAMAAMRHRGDSSGVMARVYAANTFGAVLGAILASLVWVAWVGSQRTQQGLIVLSAGAALLLLTRMPKPLWPMVPLIGVAIWSVPPLPGVLVAHGRFAASWVGKGEIVYAAEGRNSPVAVTRFDDGALTFHVAGKIQASSVARDMRLQRMLGHLTTLVPATPRSVLVIGCGAGITAGAVALDPAVERVTIAEIEPLVPQVAASWFGQQNFGVLRNPKVRVRIDDGRHFLLTSREQFDAITADPLDPWVKGAANLYTREMFQAMRDHLRPGGVVTMYIQLFEANREAVRSALATFFTVFPNGTIWGNPYAGKGHDMVLMGQREGEMRVDLDAMERRFAPVADSLAEVGMYSPTDLFGTYAGRGADLQAWLKGAAINSDTNLRMQYLAGLGLNRDDAEAIYAELLRQRRYPQGLFTGSEGRLNSIRLALLRE